MSNTVIPDTAGSAEISERFEINHVRVHSQRSFAEVKKTLETVLKRLTEQVAAALGRGDVAAAREELERIEKPTGLSILYQLDHGGALMLRGGARQAIQYGIGNVLTATDMSQHNLGAALYAPLRVLVYGVADGTVIEFDQPSTLFAIFGHPHIKEVGLKLDRQLMAVVRYAAGLTNVAPDGNV